MKTSYILVISVLCVCLLSSCAQTSTNEPTWQEQYDLGVRYLSEGSYEEAIIAFTAAIEIDPRQPLAYVGRGDAYLGSGETEENLAAAQADYEKAMELDETLESAYLGLANVYVQQGEADKALEILRQGLERTENSQLIADKLAELEKISEGDIEPEETVSYNAYGGTEFTQRNGYRDADSLTGEEFTLLKRAMELTMANDMDGLYELGKQCVESSDSDSRNIGIVSIKTILNGYKTHFFIGFPNLKRETLMIEAQFRPENGIGYDADIDETFNGSWSSRWATCNCVNWQWNGAITIVDIVSERKSCEVTGTMKDSLRDGIFISDYTYSSRTSLFQNGLQIEYDGEPQEPDNVFWGTISGLHGPLEQYALDELYW